MILLLEEHGEIIQKFFTLAYTDIIRVIWLIMVEIQVQIQIQIEIHTKYVHTHKYTVHTYAYTYVDQSF